VQRNLKSKYVLNPKSKSVGCVKKVTNYYGVFIKSIRGSNLILQILFVVSTPFLRYKVCNEIKSKYVLKPKFK